jgi:hypothetical protein
MLYFFYNKLGALMSIIGAFTGLVLIYFIPLIVNIVYYNEKHPKGHKRQEYLNAINSSDKSDKENKNEINNEVLSNEDMTLNTLVGGKGNLNAKENNYSELFVGPKNISKKPESNLKDNLFYVSQVLLMIFGAFTLFLQFYYINFFNINLKTE